MEAKRYSRGEVAQRARAQSRCHVRHGVLCIRLMPAWQDIARALSDTTIS
jgi:hypothetical protein